jgi:hypothetical protein
VLGRGDYHWQHEPCFYAVRDGKTGHWQGARDQTTLWSIANGGDEDAATVHSTQKPVECMRRPMINNSEAGDAVYEPFSGSGTDHHRCRDAPTEHAWRWRSARPTAMSPSSAGSSSPARDAVREARWRDVQQDGSRAREGGGVTAIDAMLFDQDSLPLRGRPAASRAPRSRQKLLVASKELEVGRAAEHLVCADLLSAAGPHIRPPRAWPTTSPSTRPGASFASR